MKILLTFLFIQSAIATTFNFPEGAVLLGKEYYNHKPTGATCYVQLNYAEDASFIGSHCYRLHLRFGFTTNNERHVKDVIPLQSRITNYHRVDYPQMKSCAEPTIGGNFDGAEVDIYAAETANLYNQIFSWEKKVNKLRQSVHLSFSKDSKSPVNLRLHTLSWHTESDWDCKHLVDASPK